MCDLCGTWRVWTGPVSPETGEPNVDAAQSVTCADMGFASCDDRPGPVPADLVELDPTQGRDDHQTRGDDADDPPALAHALLGHALFAPPPAKRPRTDRG